MIQKKKSLKKNSEPGIMPASLFFLSDSTFKSGLNLN